MSILDILTVGGFSTLVSAIAGLSVYAKRHNLS